MRLCARADTPVKHLFRERRWHRVPHLSSPYARAHMRVRAINAVSLDGRLACSFTQGQRSAISRTSQLAALSVGPVYVGPLRGRLRVVV